MDTRVAEKGRTKPPPPIIGKAGRYTVFLTPSTSSLNSNSNFNSNSDHSSPPPPPPPVRPPPAQFDKQTSVRSSISGFEFFWNAVAKVQDVHLSIDEFLAEWLGLNQSKYEWALNDYYTTNGIEKKTTKQKEVVNKGNKGGHVV